MSATIGGWCISHARETPCPQLSQVINLAMQIFVLLFPHHQLQRPRSILHRVHEMELETHELSSRDDLETSVSQTQQQESSHDVLRVNSSFLRAFPWQTGVVLKLPRFLGNIGNNYLMNVSRNFYSIQFTHLRETGFSIDP